MKVPRIAIARKSGAAGLDERLRKIMGMASYVGVPAEKNSRKGEKINNAELLFVLSKGSPIHHLPATPWIEPSIEADGNRQPIANELGGVAKAILDGNPTEASQRLRKAGEAGQNAARSWPSDARNGWPRLSKRTEQARMRKMKKQPKVLRETREKLAEFETRLKAGEALADLLSVYPFTRNVDTGALLKAITHVEREDEGSEIIK